MLRDGKAAVYRRFPFTLILKRELPDAVVKPMTVKIDPGAKTTGIAIVNGDNRVVFALELTHRGQAIKQKLETRASLRRGRRGRNTRYRPARFNNRTKPAGWLPPSLRHRVDTTTTWVRRLSAFAPVDELAVERVKFDMAAMQNPEVAGVEYQRGTLHGFTVWEYLLEKFNRACVYCAATGVRLEKEHIVPKALGGSDRVSNLVLACRPCNQRKGSKPIETFLAKKPDLLTRIKRQIKVPLKAAAAVNATRNALFDALLATRLPVETGTGAQTKFNRTNLGLPKAHWIDAAAVGDSGATVTVDVNMRPLLVKSAGHGRRQYVCNDAYGFPVGAAKGPRTVHGFTTGDVVRLVLPKGKHKGTYTGRLAGVRTRGSFDIKVAIGRVTSSWRNFTRLHREDGYVYS